MKNLTHAELLKLRTTRMIYWLGLAVVAFVPISVISAISTAGKSGSPALSTAEGIRNVMSAPNLGAIVALIIGILVIGGEFRHNSATSTFLVSPKRGRVVAAKLITSAMVGLVLGLISSGVTLAIALPWLSAKHIPIDIFSHNVGLVLVGGVAVMTIYPVVGLGVGALIRNQTAAIVIAIVWLLVLDNLLISFAHQIGRWTPGGATQALDGIAGHGLLPMGAGAALLVAYGLAFAFAGTRFTLRRDVS
jgi:ABC-2 type transport system permease protein